MAESTSTRDMLLDAAARLFAERGIDNVSIAEIVRTADQRNASAVHYHFGNRDEILRAVLARHVPAIAERRHELLEQARARPADDVRSAAEAIVRPGHRVRPAGLAGAGLPADRFGADRSHRPDHARDPGPHEADGGPRGVGPPARAVPAGPRRPVAGAPGDLHRLHRSGRRRPGPRCSTGGGDRGVLSDDRFVDNLIDMVIGAMTAPHRGG